MKIGNLIKDISSYKHDIHNDIYDKRIKLKSSYISSKLILNGVWRVVSENFDNIGIGIEWK